MWKYFKKCYLPALLVPILLVGCNRPHEEDIVMLEENLMPIVMYHWVLL